MRKADSKKISLFLLGFILFAWVAFLPASRCGAGMHELSDAEMAAVYAYGFSTFSLTGDIARIDFNNTTMRTWTEISSMKMGYYNNGTTTGWDNDWTNVSLGSSSNDLVAKGLYIEVKFSNIGNAATRQLEYVSIGTKDLTGTVSATFNSFSGTIGGAGYTNVSRDTTLGTSTISATNTGFHLTLARISGSGNQMGYSFHWDSATKTP